MMQIRKFVLVLGALVWLISQPYLGYAQMAESLKETYHHDGEEGVLVIDEPSMLLRLEDFLEEDQCKLIVLQLFADELTAEHCSLLLEKVREGNSLWFYDARLAGFFGMKSYRLRPDQFKNEPQEGVLGGKKCQGVATTVLAMGGHATLTGVGQATVFMPEFRDEKGEVFYSVLDPNTPGSALLRFTLDSPVVMGARRDGKGLIVFKTLLWPEVLSGDRLQRNLIEFSLGSPVPGPAGEGKIGNPPGPDAIWVGGVAPQSDSEGESVVEVVEEKEEKLSYRDRKRAQRRKLKQESFAAPDWMQKIQHDLAPGECCLINRAEEPMVLGWETAMIQLETGTDSLHINPALVERVEFARGLSMDKVFMRDGSVKKGIWFTPELSVRIQGKSQKISASNLKVILFPVVQKEE